MRKVLHILGHFNDDDIDWMSEVGVKRDVPAGQVLIEVGAQIKHIFIIVGGEFEVGLPDVGVLARLLSGELLGEMSFLEEEPPSVRVTAKTDSQVFALEHEDIRERFRDEPAFAARLYQALALFLSHRLRGTTQKMGYGKAEKAGELDEIELDAATLQRVQLAGDRFNRLLRSI